MCERWTGYRQFSGYRQCSGRGSPAILLANKPLDRKATKIILTIERSGKKVFQGDTDLGQMVREFDDLIDWLGRENDFPAGAVLLTGTGIVPDDGFTLQSRDEIAITIDGVGTLVNVIA